MPSIPLYQIDAFTSQPFKGNPAAVCLLPHPLEEDGTLRAVAAEMNLSETAFVRRMDDRSWQENRTFGLRWFTPQVEVDLCGHATLATAAALFYEVEVRTAEVVFVTRSGPLTAHRTVEGILLDFPLDRPEPTKAPPGVLEALGVTSEAVENLAYAPRTRKLLVELRDADAVRAVEPDFEALREATVAAEVQGTIVTGGGGNLADKGPYDFVSRFFAPAVGINEDPVTGSAHTVLAPYWADRLGKDEMRAYQASTRGGELRVSLRPGERVGIVGEAVVVLEGTLRLP
jgi:PhzF family phenazine biosynthesis protein